MFSKKGVMEQSIVILILILVGAVVLFLFIGGSVGKTREVFMHKLCTWSIVFKDKFIFGSNLCYTDDIKIKGESRDEVVEDIAERMVECWERMDEGRTEIDKNLFGGRYKCFKCYRLKIPELKDKITYEDFYEFLIRKEVKGKEYTYNNFFKRYDKDNEILLIKKLDSKEDLKSNFIDPNAYKYYAIVFKGYTSQYGLITLLGVAPPFTSFGVTELLKKGFSNNAIIFMPYDEYDQTCPDTIT